MIAYLLPCGVSYVTIVTVLYAVGHPLLACSIMVTVPLLVLVYLGIRAVLYLDVLLKGLQAVVSVMSALMSVARVVMQNYAPEQEAGRTEPVDWDAILEQLRREKEQ